MRNIMSWLKYKIKTKQGFVNKWWEYVEIPSPQKRKEMGYKNIAEWVQDFFDDSISPNWTHTEWVGMDHRIVSRIPKEVIREKRERANRLAAIYKVKAERYMAMLQEWYL